VQGARCKIKRQGASKKQNTKEDAREKDKLQGYE